MRIALVVVMLVAGPATYALPVAAQQVVWRESAAPAWLGVTYDLEWVQSGRGCDARVVIEGVVPGSPAERSGLRVGDAIVAVDGDRAAAMGVQLLGARLVPGDSVRLTVERSGSTRTIVAVAARRPEHPPVFSAPAPRAAPTLRAASAAGSQGPIVQIRGDTLIASKVALIASHADPALRPLQSPTRGYWLTDEGGQAVYRRLTPRPRSDLDRRVESLLTCADAAGGALSMPSGVDMERFQERAESLRVVIARRAFEHQDMEVRAAQLRAAAARAEAAVAGLDGREFFVFRREDAVAARTAGVAGAEVVQLEPELAAYFQGVRDGLLVVRVAPGTAAERGGLRPGDVITAAAGRAVTSPAAFRTVVAAGESAVDLTVVRQGRRRTLSLRP
jgi:predicted metalloprotease with PDZ domain